MSFWSTLKDVAGAVIPGVGSVISNIQQKKENNKNRQFAHNEAELAYQRQVDMWQAQNAYNAPSAQMSRLQAAGLNPNLIYGQMSPGQSAVSAPQAGSPGSSPLPGVSRGIEQALQAMSIFNQQRQIDLNAEKTAAEVKLLEMQSNYSGVQTSRAQAELDYFNSVSAIRRTAESVGLDNSKRDYYLKELQGLSMQLANAMSGEQLSAFQDMYPELVKTPGIQNAYLSAAARNQETGATVQSISAKIENLRLDFLNDAVKGLVDNTQRMAAFCPSMLGIKSQVAENVMKSAILNTQTMSAEAAMRQALSQAELNNAQRDKILKDIDWKVFDEITKPLNGFVMLGKGNPSTPSISPVIPYVTTPTQ